MRSFRSRVGDFESHTLAEILFDRNVVALKVRRVGIWVVPVRCKDSGERSTRCWERIGWRDKARRCARAGYYGVVGSRGGEGILPREIRPDKAQARARVEDSITRTNHHVIVMERTQSKTQARSKPRPIYVDQRSGISGIVGGDVVVRQS